MLYLLLAELFGYSVGLNPGLDPVLNPDITGDFTLFDSVCNDVSHPPTSALFNLALTLSLLSMNVSVCNDIFYLLSNLALVLRAY